MEVPQLLKNKYTLYGGIAAAVIGGYIFITRSANNNTGYITPITSTPYDASLVALGTEAELKKLQMQNDYASKQLDSQTNITMLGMQQNSDKELLNDAAYRMTLQTDLEGKLLYNQTQLEQSFASTALEKQIGLENTRLNYDFQSTVHEMNINHDIANQTLASNERLKASDMSQSYNLQNYQTMVQHDLGKKGIKANYYGGIISGFTSLSSKYLGG